MSKVLVDRELLELLRNFTFLHDDGCAGALRGNIDKALAARPAEAEGAGIKKFEFEIGEGGPVTEPLVRYKDHLAALSAVTADRDAALASLERAYANYNQVSYASTERGKQIDQLRAEVEALREDAERYRWLRDSGGSTFRVLETGALAKGEFYDAAIDAAMAAKEA